MSKGLRTINCWRRLTQRHWDDMPVGTVRSVRLAEGFSVSVVKTGPDTWGLHSRGGIPTAKIAELESAPRITRGLSARLNDDGVVVDTYPTGTVG